MTDIDTQSYRHSQFFGNHSHYRVFTLAGDEITFSFDENPEFGSVDLSPGGYLLYYSRLAEVGFSLIRVREDGHADVADYGSADTTDVRALLQHFAGLGIPRAFQRVVLDDALAGAEAVELLENLGHVPLGDLAVYSFERTISDNIWAYSQGGVHVWVNLLTGAVFDSRLTGKTTVVLNELEECLPHTGPFPKMSSLTSPPQSGPLLWAHTGFAQQFADFAWNFRSVPDEAAVRWLLLDWFYAGGTLDYQDAYWRLFAKCHCAYTDGFALSYEFARVFDQAWRWIELELSKSQAELASV